MDKWTQPQMNRMLKGGNQKAREFFEGQGEQWKRENLNEKVNLTLYLMMDSSKLTLKTFSFVESIVQYSHCGNVS